MIKRLDLGNEAIIPLIFASKEIQDIVKD
jgi:hypothetical protein